MSSTLPTPELRDGEMHDRHVFATVSAAFESLGQVVAFLDSSYQVLFASPALRGLIGATEIEGRPISDFIEFEAASESLKKGERCELLCDVKARPGHAVQVCAAAFSDATFDARAAYVLCMELFDGESGSESASAEAEKIIRALEANRWRRSAAARALGISRATLWRRMRDLHIL